MKTYLRFLAPFVLVTISLVAHLHAQTPSQSALIDGAKKEGKLVWYTSMAIDTSKPLLDAFEKEFPSTKTDLVRAGEVPLARADNFRIERMKREGAPVDWIETFDPIVVTISGIALSAKAANPNAAMLLINFATSRKGQEMIREMRRIPARSDVKPVAA